MYDKLYVYSMIYYVIYYIYLQIYYIIYLYSYNIDNRYANMRHEKLT